METKEQEMEIWKIKNKKPKKDKKLLKDNIKKDKKKKT